MLNELMNEQVAALSSVIEIRMSSQISMVLAGMRELLHKK